MKIYTKDSLIEALHNIRDMGWIKSRRPGNDGAVGNTLEDLLEIPENNLPIPNAAEWEIKAQRENTSSLITLFHMEPSPRALKFIPKILLPIYGWRHQDAGKRHSESEMSFRQTICAGRFSDRGFSVQVDRQDHKIVVIFDKTKVSIDQSPWLDEVIARGGGFIEHNPYWGFMDLYHKAGTKLKNCFLIRAESKKEDGEEYFKFKEFMMLKDLSLDNFINAIDSGDVYIDFDARTGHNHGTKFRIREKKIPDLYNESIIL